MFGAQPMMSPYAKGPMGMMANPYQQYGSAAGEIPNGFNPFKSSGFMPFSQRVLVPVMHGPGARRKLNAYSIVLSFLIPCAIYFATFHLMSFSLHYLYPKICYLLCAGVLAITLCLRGVDAHHTQKRREGFAVEPSWFSFLFATCFLAWCAGFFLGEYNYSVNMGPYFDRSNMRILTNVDPGEQVGQQLMDAGQIYFKPGSYVDKKLAYSYTKTDTYCVAPVVSADGAKLASYDFWAVGVNCCFAQGDFSCGDMFDPKVHAGLRWWGDEEQAKFRMALGQSVAANNIQASHPIFIEWVESPNAENNQHLRTAWAFLVECAGCFALMQAVLVGLATFYYSKLHAVHLKMHHYHLYHGPTQVM